MGGQGAWPRIFCCPRLLAAGGQARALLPPFPADAFPDVAWLKREVVMLPVHQDLEPAEIARLQACVAAA